MTCEDPVVHSATWAELIDDAAALATGDGRRILGIAGPPGAGKSVLADTLTDALTDRGFRVALAGMDGFHLAGAELTRLGRADRKGAPDTFDAAGYVNLLRRLRQPVEPIVYAPLFDRALEEPIGSAVPIPHDTSLVITEGNYLLLQAGAWIDVAGLLDECWYIDSDEQLRLDRLIARHMFYGRSQEQARERSYGSDQRNADLVIATRGAATRIVVLPSLGS
jgi:pantothenate kinase